MVQIIPAILAKTEAEFRDLISKVELCSHLGHDWVHIDLMDNKFVQNQTININDLKNNPTKLKKEIHLMVEKPSEWIDELIQSGVEFERVVLHIECEKEELNFAISKLQSAQKELFLAFNPETAIYKYESPINGVLVMGVKPGFGGQEFITETVEKVRAARSLFSKEVIIGVDGGIDDKSAKLVVELGADYVVSGSFLLKGEIDENIKKIKESLAR